MPSLIRPLQGGIWDFPNTLLEKLSDVHPTAWHGQGGTGTWKDGTTGKLRLARATLIQQHWGQSWLLAM
jgi:hypothetical protein